MRVTNKDLVKYIIEKSKHSFKNEVENLLGSLVIYCVMLPIVLMSLISIIVASVGKFIAGGSLLKLIVTDIVPVSIIGAIVFMLYLKLEILREEASERIVKIK